MFSPLPTPEEMAAWDTQAVTSYEMPGIMLMESAAHAAAGILLSKSPDPEKTRAFVFAGPGNNGGDGFALARYLDKAGMEVCVFHAGPIEAYANEARWHADLARTQHVPMQDLNAVRVGDMKPPDLVVDALLGIGLRGAARPPFDAWIRQINTLGRSAQVVALDVPSGLDTRTGIPGPDTVRAKTTITFEAAKLGLVLPQAREFVGELHVADIGFPKEIARQSPCAHRLISPQIRKALPEMESDMHKGRAGHVLVLGGSPGMTGAPVLSSLGALRSGAGLATLAVPEDLAPAVPRSFPDIMIHTFAHQSRWTAEIARDLDRFFRCTAWVVGPGLGRDKETTAFVAALLDQLDTLPPVLFDADGLYHLAKLSPRHLNIQKTVLTPHPGEAATLLQGPIPETFAQRSEAAETLARKYRCTVVLKGAATLVAAPGHPLSVAPFAEPCLAVAGSGDVLSGIIGSLLARGLEPLTAACLGVYWHGLCGRSLSRRFPLRGNLATDIANALPQTLKELAS